MNDGISYFGLLTLEQLEAIRSRYLLATPGAWLWTETQAEDGTPLIQILGAVESGHLTNLKTIAVLGADRTHDADFITHVHNDVFMLLVEIEHLRGLLSLLSPKVTKPREEVS